MKVWSEWILAIVVVVIAVVACRACDPEYPTIEAPTEVSADCFGPTMAQAYGCMGTRRVVRRAVTWQRLPMQGSCYGRAGNIYGASVHRTISWQRPVLFPRLRGCAGR